MAIGSMEIIEGIICTPIDVAIMVGIRFRVCHSRGHVDLIIIIVLLNLLFLFHNQSITMNE